MLCLPSHMTDVLSLSLAVASSGSGGNTALKNVVPGSCFVGNTTSLLNIAFAFGLSIFVMVYGAASFSGELPLCSSQRPRVTFQLPLKLELPLQVVILILLSPWAL